MYLSISDVAVLLMFSLTLGNALMLSPEVEPCSLQREALMASYSQGAIERKYAELFKKMYDECQPPGLSYFTPRNCTNVLAEKFVAVPGFNKQISPPFSNDRRTFIGNLIFNAHFQYDAILMNLFFMDPLVLHGKYVEFGAWDGLANSNSLAFQQNLNWSGLLLEPSECVKNVRNNRPHDHAVQGAICAEPGNYTSPDFDRCKGTSVECFPLQHYLDTSPDPLLHIDLLSVDTEGHEKVDVASVDFNRTTVSVIQVEENGNKEWLTHFFRNKGYNSIEFRYHDANTPEHIIDLIFWNPKVLVEAAMKRAGC